MSSDDGPTQPADEIRISRNGDDRRFEIFVAGERAGLAAYLDAGDRRIFFHTEVHDRFAGRGLAARLVSEALAATRAAGMRIVPVCPYVARYLRTHHEVDDAVDAVTPQALEAVRAAVGS